VTGTAALRPPQEADVDALVELVVACNETYVDFAPAGWAPPSGEALREQWIGALPVEPGWTRVALGSGAEVDGLVHWVTGRQATWAVLPPDVAFVGALFVHPRRFRTGLGSLLLDAAEEAMVDAGCRRGELYTPLGAPAEAFYRARGWSRDGREGHHLLLALRIVGYAKPLG